VTVLTLGTFDTPHLGHAIFLRRCSKLGPLRVGVNTDEFVEQYKGRPPLFTFDERTRLIEQLGYPTLPNPSAGRDTILRIKPDVLAVGADWAGRDYYGQIGVRQWELDQWGITLMYVAFQPIISTTWIVERARG